VSRHVSAEVLASLELDAVKPRKAARIRAHVSTCVQCTQLSSEVSAVPRMLASASASYEAMPESLTVRLNSAIATESAQRLAQAPASEAGRRDLPERSSRVRPERHGWQLPGLSVLATRLVAATGALVIVGVGGYEIATNAVGTSNSGTAASSGGAAVLPRSAAPQLSLGPAVHYGPSRASKAIRMVSSNMNFQPAKLAGEAIAAVAAARVHGAVGFNALGAPTATSGANGPAKIPTASSAGAMTGCLDRIAGSQTVLLVEMARYSGRPAMIIVTAANASRSAQVWVVAPTCSGSHPDVLHHLRLSRT
jgi:hypothetical protein